jgi:hypothetical protein
MEEDEDDIFDPQADDFDAKEMARNLKMKQNKKFNPLD